MAPEGGGSGAGLALPFLVDGFTSPIERLNGIANEVEAYIAARAGIKIPDYDRSTDELPDTLYWLQRVEKWGPLFSGGQLEQPFHFMQDIEMAALGRTRALSAMNTNKPVESSQVTEGNSMSEKVSLADFIDMDDLKEAAPGGV